MKEELLQQMKEELEERKKEIALHNEKAKRIKELLKDPKVKEYIKLMNLGTPMLKQIKKTDEEIISSFYSKYTYRIKENETNKIFVYLGTYKYSKDYDICHYTPDIQVDYDSDKADYRLYQDLEDSSSKLIPIKQCEQFEKENIIIIPNTRYRRKEYYDIRQEFFIKAIKKDQESAKKLVLKKYKRLNNKR